MEIRIFWSQTAEKQLNDIFDYYSFEINTRIARKIINKIIDRVSILMNNPQLGPKEELLEESDVEYRYLVESNYKIIYWLKDNTVTIAAVFDCRQNPNKIKDI